MSQIQQTQRQQQQQKPRQLHEVKPLSSNLKQRHESSSAAAAAAAANNSKKVVSKIPVIASKQHHHQQHQQQQHQQQHQHHQQQQQYLQHQRCFSPSFHDHEHQEHYRDNVQDPDLPVMSNNPKIVKFNLNPSYSSNHQHHNNKQQQQDHHQHRGGRRRDEEQAATSPLERASSASFMTSVSEETGLELDPDVLNRNKRNLPDVPSFKHATSPTMPMAKMKLLKDMISSSDLNFKRKMQLSPVPRYSMEHEMKYGTGSISGTAIKSRISTVPRGSASYFSKSPTPPPPPVYHPPSSQQRHPSYHHDAYGHQQQQTSHPDHHHHHHHHPMMQRSLPASPVRATTPLFRASRIRAHKSFLPAPSYPSLRTSHHLHHHGYNFDPPSSLMHHQHQHRQHQHGTSGIPPGGPSSSSSGTCCCPCCCPASCNQLTSTTGRSGVTLSNPDLRAPYRYSFITHQPPYATGPESAAASAAAAAGVRSDCSACCQRRHQHQQQQQQHSLFSPSSICCMSPGAGGAGGGTSRCCRHQLLHRNSDPALTSTTTTSKFPSVSEITRPPFLDPSFNLIEKYEYNFDNYFKAKRDLLQPFYRSSAPGSRSGTPTTNVSLINPFISGSLTPPPCSSALSNTTLASGMLNNSGRISRNRPMSQATAGNCDHTIPDLEGQEISTKSKFKNQLKYFVEERKGELGYNNTYQPQTGSVTDVNTLMNLYSDPPDPVRSRFPPPGVSAYQSVPQSYFDPNSTTFTSLRDPVPNVAGTNFPRRRHSFGGERECYLNSGSNLQGHRLTSASPYPSYYASYAPPAASSLLNIHQGDHSGNPMIGFMAGTGTSEFAPRSSGFRPSSPYPRDQCSTRFMDDRTDQQIHSLLNEASLGGGGGMHQMQQHQQQYPHPSSSFDSYHHQMHDQQMNQGMPFHHAPYHHSHQQQHQQQQHPHSYPHTSADPMNYGIYQQEQQHQHRLQHQHSFPAASSLYLSSSQHHHNLSPSRQTHPHQHSHHFTTGSSSTYHPSSTHRSFRTDHW